MSLLKAKGFLARCLIERGRILKIATPRLGTTGLLEKKIGMLGRSNKL